MSTEEETYLQHDLGPRAFRDLDYIKLKLYLLQTPSSIVRVKLADKAILIFQKCSFCIG